MSIQLKPSEIVARLNEHVIGQENAKKTLAVAIYGHFRRMASSAPASSPIAVICITCYHGCTAAPGSHSL